MVYVSDYSYSNACLSRIPAAYLNHVSEVFLDGPGTPLVDERTVPSLQLLRIELSPDQTNTAYGLENKVQVCKWVVKLARDLFEGSPVHTELEKRRSEKELPFRVILEIGCIMVYHHERDTHSPERWTGLKIDWEKQEIVGGWPPPQWKSADEQSEDGELANKGLLSWW